MKLIKKAVVMLVFIVFGILFIASCSKGKIQKFELERYSTDIKTEMIYANTEYDYYYLYLYSKDNSVKIEYKFIGQEEQQQFTTYEEHEEYYSFNLDGIYNTLSKDTLILRNAFVMMYFNPVEK